jgi:hypothetical protein
MLDAVVRIASRRASGGFRLFRRVLKITGRPESDVDALVQPIYGRGRRRQCRLRPRFLAVLGQVELHLTARARSKAEGDEALDAASKRCGARLVRRHTASTAERSKPSSGNGFARGN